MLGYGNGTPNDGEIKRRNNLKMFCRGGVRHEVEPNRLPLCCQGDAAAFYLGSKQ